MINSDSAPKKSKFIMMYRAADDKLVFRWIMTLIVLIIHPAPYAVARSCCASGVKLVSTGVGATSCKAGLFDGDSAPLRIAKRSGAALTGGESGERSSLACRRASR